MTSTITRPRRVEYLSTAVVLVIGGLLFAAPFLWSVSSSLKPRDEVLDIPPHLIPDHPTWASFTELVTELQFGRYLGNTMVVVALSFVGLLFNAMAGYGFAKFQFRGRGVLFLTVLATMMIPVQVAMIPTYLMLNEAGLTNTRLGIALPTLVSAFGVFLFRQFMTTIPDSLLEAARIDGAGEARIFFRIVLPLCGPILAVQGTLTFIAAWNSFLWPLIIANDQNLYTLSVGLSLLQGQNASDFGLQMAGAVFMVAPVLVIFIAFQRFVVQGFTTSGLK